MDFRDPQVKRYDSERTFPFAQFWGEAAYTAYSSARCSANSSSLISNLALTCPVVFEFAL